jgi:Phage integrase family
MDAVRRSDVRRGARPVLSIFRDPGPRTQKDGGSGFLCVENDDAASRGITQAGRHATAADQVVDAARAVHQGVRLLSEPDTDPNGASGVLGYRTSQVHPKVDERPVRLGPAAPRRSGRTARRGRRRDPHREADAAREPESRGRRRRSAADEGSGQRGLNPAAPTCAFVQPAEAQVGANQRPATGHRPATPMWRIRTCEFDCLSPPERAVQAAEGVELVRFRYAQSKIDVAPNTILVDREVAAVIEEQQAWVRKCFPTRQPRFLFVQRTGNRRGDKPYPSGTYQWMLREFSDVVQITDSAGRRLQLSHTHRFRHAKLTRLAELGLPIHVLQRYAGHATPTMSMHYVAQREEHAEQAFLATAKLKADGSTGR